MHTRYLYWFFSLILAAVLLIGFVSLSATSASAGTALSVQAISGIGARLAGVPPTPGSPGVPGTSVPDLGGSVAPQKSDRPASIITVNTTSDSGAGSLRQAIIDAINGDIINFNRGLAGQVIVLSSGQLDINKSLTIDGSQLGSRVSVSGNMTQRVFNISNNATVTLKGLTVINGNANDGAGVYVTGGSTLNLNNCLSTGNIAGHFGGGVYNAGTLNVVGCIFSNNQASWGGGLENQATLSVVGTTFINNTSTSGGAGVETYGGSVTIAKSAFINNISFDGGNVGSGGGFQSDPNTANVNLTNITFSGNRARGSADDGGGAIMSYGGTLYLSHVTLVGNYSASHGGGISTNPGYSTTINFNNTIIYNNTAGTGNPDDLYGTFNSQDYNLIGTLTGAVLTGNTSHNLVGTNPELNTLSDNGSGSSSFALLPGSPAIDRIPGGTNGCGSTQLVDQRGRPRPVNYPDYSGGCDMGAFELQTAEIFTATLGDGATQTFGATLTSIQDNPGGAVLGLMRVIRTPITSTLLSWMDLPFRVMITGTVSSGLDFNLSLCYTGWEASLNPHITPTLLELYHRSGTTWLRIGADNRYTDPLTGVTCVTKNNVSNLGRWALMDPSVPTAVSLVGFSAKVENHILALFIGLTFIVAGALALVSLRVWKHKPLRILTRK